MLRIASIAGLCFASSLLGSAVTVFLLAPAPEPPAAAPGYLTVHEIALTDASGRTSMRLQGEPYAGAPGGQIVFYDERGALRMHLAMETGGPSITLQTSELPDPDHRRIRIAADRSTARIDVGHGELEEIVVKSGLPTEPPANVVEVNARNGSSAALFTDVFGHATAEVTDLTTRTVFRAPEERPLLP